MRKRIIIALLIYLPIFAQDNNNQSIELPDFVITGTQDITVPEAEKSKPKLFQSLAQEFFKPSFSPQQLSLAKFSNPLSKDFIAFDVGNYNNGLLILGAGLETLPTGNFYFTQSSQPILFTSHVYGTNINEYIENAGYNISGVEGELNIFTNTKSSLLPGLKITLGGNYQRDNYKLFASNTPDYKRENELVETELGFKSGLNPNLKYSLSGNYSILKFKDNGFSEKLLKGNLYFEAGFGNFAISANTNFTNQFLRNNVAVDDSYIYTSNKISFHVKTVQSFNVKLGFAYSQMDTVKLLSPIASFDLKLDDGVNFYGEYSPHTVFHTTKSLLKLNRYYIPNAIDNNTTKYNAFVKVAFEFQHRKFFELNLGVRFASIDNLPYFNNSNASGVFDIVTEDDVKYFNAFINGLFHEGPFGYLYFDASFNRYKNIQNFNVPYKPNITAAITYAYPIYAGLNLGVNLNYLGKSYLDLANTNSINSYIDLGFFAKQKFYGGLDFTIELNNILNKKNYIFENYQEKPFDIIAGIEYRW